MTKQQYIRQVARTLDCTSAKKSEILRQLESDIDIALGEGRELPEILEEMGSPKALAGEFNENLDQEERRQGKRRRWMRRILCILGGMLALLAVLAAVLWWMLPKMKDIENSKYFHAEKVRSCTEEIIRLFGEEDYETLEGRASEELREALKEAPFPVIRDYIGGDWGELISIGTIYMVEIHEKNRVYATAQVTASYENTNVTYTLSFNRQMELYGFYIR